MPVKGGRTVRIKCLCNVDVTANTWHFHISGKKCKLSQEIKNEIQDIIDIRQRNPRGWLKKDGAEALSDPLWYISVINKQTNLSDWNLSSPRKQGENRPSIYRKSSIDRQGLGNPAIKAMNFDYTLNDIKNIGLEILNQIEKDVNLNYFDIFPIIEKTYPKFIYLMSNSLDKTKSKTVAFMAWLHPEWKIEAICNKITNRRGLKISIGQKNSEKFVTWASKHGSEMTSTWRVTKPATKLFSMILQEDICAVQEYRLQHTKDNKWMSFDVFSPKLNALIEMNGRVWHELNEKTRRNPKMMSMVEKNLLNDERKRIWAIENNYKHFIFWDDEIESWQKRIKEMFDGTQNTQS